MKVLFLSSGNTIFEKVPFIESQEESIKDNGVLVDHFLINEGGVMGYFKAIPKLKAHLKANSYDVIHAHYSYCGWVAVLTMTKLPIVVSYMGSDVYGAVDTKGRRLLKSYPVLLMAKLLQFLVDRIITKSKNLNDYIILKKKSVIIPNGVNFDRFQPRDKNEVRQQLNLPLDKKLVVFMANPEDPRKNIKLVRDAVAHIGDPQVQVVSPFPVAPKEVGYYINAADVLVLSSYLEGSPNIVKEAMASNCPIVATPSGDVTEIISNTKGCYITSYEVEDAAENIQKALNFEGPTTGRADIAHLEINATAQRIISLYKELIV